MAASLATKRRWFDRGAEAFERTFPGEIKAEFGDDAPAMYVCPLCDTPHARDAVEEGTLTAEHVPPECFDGRELLLTCKRCNNEAGTVLDAEARKMEDVSEALRGRVRKPVKVRARRGAHAINAQVKMQGEQLTLHVEAVNDNPSALAAFKALPPSPGSTIDVEFVQTRYTELGARISWLRSGYLALFATLGYQFWYDPALAIVQEQIAKPARRLIYSHMIDLPPTYPWSEKRILDIPDPRCVGVQFGRYVVLLPPPGDVTFYSRREKAMRSSTGARRIEGSVPTFLWSDEPSFGYSWDSATDATLITAG